MCRARSNGSRQLEKERKKACAALRACVLRCDLERCGCCWILELGSVGATDARKGVRAAAHVISAQPSVQNHRLQRGLLSKVAAASACQTPACCSSARNPRPFRMCPATPAYLLPVSWSPGLLHGAPFSWPGTPASTQPKPRPHPASLSGHVPMWLVRASGSL